MIKSHPYFYAAIILFLLACQARIQRNEISADAVMIESGMIAGASNQNGSVKFFKGIPYAVPPIGDLRWKAPQPVLSWAGVRECTTFAPSAMQGPPVPFFAWSKEFLIPEKPISEDCLYLNVWTGADYTDEKKPVFVWIHGGGFTAGSGSVPLYDGEEMAKKGVVFITINYRLGIFGFMAHPELSEESELGVSGNYGILDQIAALEWIKANVIHFGGDPDNVTLAGQSAGAFSVNALTASPLSKGLFHKAIAQSGGMFRSPDRNFNTLHVAELAGLKVQGDLGANSLSELRKLSADSLMQVLDRFGPVIDDEVIPDLLLAFESGNFHDVPLLTGWNADDNVSFGNQVSPVDFQQAAKEKYGDKSDAYLSLFPAKDEKELMASQQLLGQLFFGWQNYMWAKLQTEKGENPAYLYHFTHIPPGEPDYGAFHSAEFGYALHNLHLWERPFEEWDHQLADKMSSYWVNFAKTGNPNGPELPQWPTYTADKKEVMEFGKNARPIALPHQAQLELLESLMP